MTLSRIFLYLCLMFIFGVGLGSFFKFSVFGIYLIFLAIIIFLVFFWHKPLLKILILGGLFLLLGIFRYQISVPEINDSHIAFYNSRTLTFQGIIVDELDARINHIKYTLGDLEINGEKIKGKVLLTNTLYPQFQYGGRLEITCELKKPEPFSDFAYDRYLERYGIYSTCSFAKIKLLAENFGNPIFTKIFAFKQNLIASINSYLPEPQASLFNGMVLGSRQGIPKDLNDKFNLTGTTHLIAISGLNITLIINLLLILAINLYIPRQKAFYLITLLLIIYLILIGLPASAVRAGIMGWLVLFAMQIGRLNKAGRAIVFAAALMILQNPKILRDDVGFQLSFLAILGIVYFYPLLEKYFKRFPKTLGIKDSLQMTLAAQIATLPLVVYNFGRLSLIAPIINILVIPPMPYLLALGFLALALVFILPLFWQIIFFPSWLILAYIIKLVEIFAAIPYAALNFEKKSLLVPVFLAGLVVYAYFKLKNQNSKIKMTIQKSKLTPPQSSP